MVVCTSLVAIVVKEKDTNALIEEEFVTCYGSYLEEDFVMHNSLIWLKPTYKNVFYTKKKKKVKHTPNPVIPMLFWID